jgi:hypothetical protein
MATRKNIEEEILRDIAATGPEAARLVEKLRRLHTPGRRPKLDSDFRRLDLRWKSFKKRNSGLDAKQQAKKFFRHHGKQIKAELGLSRQTYDSLRMAVARGAKESANVNQRRRSNWQIVPAGLARAVEGRRYEIVTDPNEAALRRAAIVAAYLGRKSD